MSLKDALTEHANVLRSKTGVSIPLSINDMTLLLNDLSWNKTNLLKGTSSSYRSLILDGWGQDTTANTSGGVYIPVDKYSSNTHFTYSATITNKGQHEVKLEINQVIAGNKITVVNDSDSVGAGEVDKNVLVSTLLGTDVEALICWIIVPFEKGNKDERLYEGTEPGIWTPNPSDLTGGQN